MNYDKDAVKKYHITINSADRDQIRFPTPQSYDIDLPETLYGIVSIDLLEASIPNSQYIIDDYNNYFRTDFGFFGSEGHVEKGDFLGNPSSIGKVIASGLNSVTTAGNKVILNTDQTKYKINKVPLPTYTLHTDANNSISYLLGTEHNSVSLLPSGAPVVDSYLVTNASGFFPNRFQIKGSQNVLLRLKCNQNTVGNIRRPGINVDESNNLFADISLTSNPGAFTYFTKNNSYDNKYCFTAGPLDNLKTLSISFWNNFKQKLSPYNFNGLEHTLKFEITAHLDKSWSRGAINKCNNFRCD